MYSGFQKLRLDPFLHFTNKQLKFKSKLENELMNNNNRKIDIYTHYFNKLMLKISDKERVKLLSFLSEDKNGK